MTKVLGYASKEDLSIIELLRKESLNRNVIGNVDTSKGWKIETKHIKDRDVIAVRVDKEFDFKRFGPNTFPVFVFFIRLIDGSISYNGWTDKNDPTSKIIEDWEFKQSLSSNTIKTFSELIDEL
jgi:hypothetical protein